jgi:hypothetical protein
MNPLDRIAEARLEEAIANGLFEDLPGFGKPLELEDLSQVAPELRASYLLLKGAGVLPEELVVRKELLSLNALLAACEDDETRLTLQGRRTHLLLRHERLRAARGLS